MRWSRTIAGTALIGIGLMSALPPAASATGFGHRSYAPRYGTPAFAGPTPPPHRYFRCRGGRFYTFLGGWGCDYYYHPYHRPRGR